MVPALVRQSVLWPLDPRLGGDRHRRDGLEQRPDWHRQRQCEHHIDRDDVPAIAQRRHDRCASACYHQHQEYCPRGTQEQRDPSQGPSSRSGRVRTPSVTRDQLLLGRAHPILHGARELSQQSRL